MVKIYTYTALTPCGSDPRKRWSLQQCIRSRPVDGSASECSMQPDSMHREELTAPFTPVIFAHSLLQNSPPPGTISRIVHAGLPRGGMRREKGQLKALSEAACILVSLHALCSKPCWVQMLSHYIDDQKLQPCRNYVRITNGWNQCTSRNYGITPLPPPSTGYG